MNERTTPWTTLATGLFFAGVMATSSQAQTSDALLNKLVEKGILTTQEANTLKKEADEESKKDFSKSFQARTGMPDWVTSLKFNGDFRGRYEGFFMDDPTLTDRNRFRYRVRFGATATLKDQFEVGLRLTSSEPARGGAGQTGDPISGNTTLTDNGSKKGIYIDAAYAKWTGLKFDNVTGSLTFGKMDNPFVYSSMLFDHDYTPEGLAAQLNYKLGDHHSLKWIGGGFSVLELGSSSYDSVMLGSQLRLDSAWTPKIATSAGVGILTLLNEDKLVNSAIPNQNAGNSRVPVFSSAVPPAIVDSRPAYNFNTIFADAALTYNLESFPLYKGKFPIKPFGEYMVNPAADVANSGYQVGIGFGKAGKKGLWELSYAWRYLEANAWFEEYPESDFGANYVTPSGNISGVLGRGYNSGTNVRGHIVKASYSLTDALTLTAAWYHTELIDPGLYSAGFGTSVRPGGSSEVDRLQVDATWKF